MLLDFTVEELCDIFYIKDDVLYWKKRVKGDKFRSNVTLFNMQYADKPCGDTLQFTYANRKCKRLVSRRVLESLKLNIVVDAISNSDQWDVWNSIRGRVGKREGYLNVTMSETFSDYTNWYNWAVKQKGFKCLDLNGRIFVIDKDILSENGSSYSENTCVFVPSVINILKCSRSKLSGDEVVGVQYFKGRSKPYRAYMQKEGKHYHLGYYHTEIEAQRASKESRFKYLKELEAIYGSCVDDRVFPALYKKFV